MMGLPPELCPGLCLAQYPTSPGVDSRGVGPPLHVLYRSLLVRAALHAVSSWSAAHRVEQIMCIKLFAMLIYH